MTVLQQDWAAKWAVYSPEKIALKAFESGETVSYKALNDWGMAVAHGLKTAYGVEKGDRVAVLAEYDWTYVALFVAAQKAGFILVPLNYRLSPSEMAYLCQDAAPKLVLFEPKFEPLLADTEGGAVQETLVDFFENIKKINVYQFENESLDEDDPIFILYTSGTTGFPKGALYTHKMLFWNSINTAMSLIVNTDSRTIVCTPPFHTGGWNVLLTPFLHHGGYVCLMKKFDAAAILTALQTERCTLFMGVPTMLRMMADLPEFEHAAFPDLHYFIVGGEAMPIPLIEKWHDKHVLIRQGYGMTEVGPNLTSLHQSDAVRKKGSIGRPNFYVETRILAENGQEGTVGELLLRGPMVTTGYWRQPEATANSFFEGWFRTGDRVRRDAEGYLFIEDRIKNMYISGGENVYPAEVERIMLTMEGISEVAIVGVPDAQWGEVGRAFVVKKPHSDLTETAINIFLKSHLAKYKIPKYIVFLDALPKNDTGKINKKQLKMGI